MAKIVSLGRYFSSTLISENIDFWENESVLGADILFIDLYPILNNSFHYSRDNWNNLNSQGKNNLNNDIERRSIEVKDILKRGGNVFVFIPPKMSKYGINLEEILQEVIFNSDPDSSFTLLNSSSKHFQINHTTPFNLFFEENIDFFYPKSYFDTEDIPFLYTEADGSIEPITLLKIKNSSMPLSFYYKLNNGGNLFLIPEIKTREDMSKGYKKAEDKFILSIIDLVNNLNSSNTQEFDFPKWLNKYSILDEKEHIKKLKTTEDKFLKLQKQIESQKNKLQSIQKYKLLLSSHSEMLENLVEKIFKDLGFEIIKNEKSNRVDFTLKYKNKNFVVEVKGKTKSAAEKDARQLQVWVAEHSFETEQEPKGLLIVNTFRDIPINKRKESSFPFSEGTVVQKNEFCLMTTLQLLCLYIDCKNNPTKIDKIVNKIFKYTGEFPEYQNWQDYININE